jgi:predicted DNA-binding protein with PD1-like motif
MVIRLDEGEEIVSGIEDICLKEGYKNGVILSIIGAIKECELVFREGCREKFRDHFEIVGNGNLTTIGNKPKAHLHIVAGNDRVLKTGHLVEGEVTIFCEIIIQRLEGFKMERILDSSLDPKKITLPYRLKP